MTDDHTFELTMTGMASGGSAVGRYEGRVVFVPYTIPGETIRVRISQDKGRFVHAELVEVVQPSSERIMPRCKHFAHCGGCHWQHIDYPAQLAYKQQIVADQMRRIGGFHDLTVPPTIPSPEAWQYRSHVTFHPTQGRLGFVSTDGQTLLPIDECHILRPELQAMMESFTPPGAAERIRLQVGSDADERLVVLMDSDERTSAPVKQEAVHYTVSGRRFQVSAGSFFQVNLHQAETLVRLVLERLGFTGSKRVLDLYSGVGLFTAFLAPRARHVSAVESYPQAIRDATANLADYGNIRLLQGTVEGVLPRLNERFDAAVLDPPRAGMERAALDALVKCRPRQIVYVSCDPATLARDAKRLCESGYHLLDVQPVDMFPQTYHIEAVAAFTKN